MIPIILRQEAEERWRGMKIRFNKTGSKGLKGELLLELFNCSSNFIAVIFHLAKEVEYTGRICVCMYYWLGST